MNRKSGEETRFLSHFSKTNFRSWSGDSSKCFDSVECGPVISLHKAQAQARKAACPAAGGRVLSTQCSVTSGSLDGCDTNGPFCSFLRFIETSYAIFRRTRCAENIFHPTERSSPSPVFSLVCRRQTNSEKWTIKR